MVLISRPLGFFQPEKEEPVPFSTRRLLSDGGQRLEVAALILEALVENLDHDIPALKFSDQQSPGQGQPGIH